jgi:cytosine/adenosine deaminase-related metal-dependent hydrolase
VLFTADVVCPMDGPPLARGGVLVDAEVIVAVGDARGLRGDADRVHHVDGVLLPGLVNAHTHLERTDTADGQGTDSWSDEGWSRSAHRGVLAALRTGTTTVGDVVTRGAAVPAATRAGLAGDSWVEVTRVDVDAVDAVLPPLEHALALPAPGRRVGIAPYAAATLGTGVLQALAALATRAGVPLHLHAAETPAEDAAIRAGRGPFAERARAAGYGFEWLEGGTSLGVIAYLDACAALTPQTTIAHGVHVDADDAALLADREVTVVCCPRANARSGAQAPLEHYAEAGTRLAVGTEHLGVAEDGDLLAEAAAWVRLAGARGLSTWHGTPLDEHAVHLATIAGATAMGWGERSGLLAPGRRADLVGVAVDTTPDAVYRDLLERGPGRQVLTVLAGVRKARRADADVLWPPLAVA